MRCPDCLCSPYWRLAFGALSLLAATAAQATAESVRSEVAARLLELQPAIAATDYVLGAAAFDPELRAKADENAAAPSGVLEAGGKIWSRKLKNGRTLAGCFPNGGRRIVAAYPLFDARLKRVVTLETAINQCLKTHGEALLDATDPATMGALTAYVRSLSDGQKVAVRVNAASEAKFEQGRATYFARTGQRNFACASCHLEGAGKRYDGTPLSPAIGQATHWPVIREGRAITLQARIRECLELMGAAPFAAGSDELNHLEYFLTYLSNGLALKANAWRPAKNGM